MGVSHHNRYKITKHARERYLERIDSTKSELDVIKDIREILGEARFLSKEHRGCESWLYENRNIVVIINPKKYSVVTIYNSIEQYDNTDEDTKNDNDVHSKVQAIISNASKTAYVQQEKVYFSKLAPMYKEYGDRIDKLSRTKNTEYFENKKIELDDLQREIRRVVSEKNRVLSDLKQFIAM